MSKDQLLHEAHDALVEAFDFIDGIQCMVDTEREEWNGTDGEEGLNTRLSNVIAEIRKKTK